MKLLSLWLPVVLWMGVIFFMSSRPALHASDIQTTDFVIKKSAHFLEYLFLGLLLARAMRPTTKRSYLIIFLLCLAYAASDEFHQSFVPGREPHIRDVAIDCLGAATGLFFRLRMSTTG